MDKETENEIKDELTAIHTEYIEAVIKLADKYGLNRDDLFSSSLGILQEIAKTKTLSQYSMEK